MAKSKEQESKDYSDNWDVLDTARDLVQRRFNESHNNQNLQLNNFIKWYELYRNVQSNKHYHGRANLFVPEPFTIVESIHARIVRSFAGIKAKPQEANDLVAAENAENLLDYQTRVYNWKEAFKDMDKAARIYGTGILKVSWIFNEKGKKDHPMIECVDPLHYFFDPNATSRQNMRWEIQRTERSMEELKANPNYFNLDKLEEQVPAPKTNDSYEARRKSIIGQPTVPETGKNRGKYEILEYWGMFKTDEDDEDEEAREFLIVLANNDVVIRLEENPNMEIFKDKGVVEESMVRPFVLMKDVDVPFEVYGIGEIEPIERLVEELNDTRNQRMDNVTDVIDHMWYVIDQADIDENELVRRPGGIIHGAMPGGVTPLPVGDVTQSAYNEETIIKEDIRKAVGLPEVATGSLQGQQGEAAATILSLQESANIRFDTKLSAFADAVRHAYSLVLAFNQSWLDKKVTARLESEEGFEFVEIDKDSIKGKFDIDVQMDTQMNKIVRRQEAFQLYGLLASNPMINQQANTKILLESVDRKEVQELMTVEPPPPPMPEGPKKSISVTLKGDLNALESDDLAVVMGAKQESADPIVRPELRELMQESEEDRPEISEGRIKEAELEEKFMEEERLTKREQADSILKAKELELKERELEMKGAEMGKDTLSSRIKGVFNSKGKRKED